MLGVLLRQRLAADEEAEEQAEARERHVEDEHGAQGPPVGVLRDAALRLRQGGDLLDARRGARRRQQARRLGAEAAHEGVPLVLHLGVEEDAADDDGDGRRQLPDEHEGARRAGDVPPLERVLQRDQGRLEVGADAEAEDDLVQDDLGPVGVRVEIDEEAVPERHEGEAADDGRQVLAGLLDHEARDRGRHPEDEGEGQDVDAGQERAGAEDALEVQGHVVADGDEDEAVAGVEPQDGDVPRLLEDLDGDQGELGDVDLDEDAQAGDQDAEDEQADDGRGAPRPGVAGQLEAEEEHERAADDGEGAEPVYGHEALLDGRAWVVQLQGEIENGQSSTADGEIYIKTPSPGRFRGKHATEHYPRGKKNHNKVSSDAS